MKSIGGYLSAAVLLAVLGGLVVTAGRIEGRLAAATEAFAAFDFDAAATAYSELEPYQRYATFVPWLSDDLQRVRAQGAAVRYWEGDHEGLLELNDPETADPETLLVAANAIYRLGRARGADREALTRALDLAQTAYQAVLTRDGTRSDAAFNYEYVIRLRDELAKIPATAPPATSGADAGAGRTLHGREGAAAPDQPPDRQKVYIPLDPEDLQRQKSTPSGDQIRGRKG